MNALKSILAHIPHAPGVYQFMNAEGDFIYIGKAIDLKKRVSSYFRKRKDLSMRLTKLVENVADIQYTVVDSELEALILETNLIKAHRPRYNVLMKDDKNYVYLKVTVQETYPRVYVARRLERDGARYFGPKTSASSIHRVLRVLKKVFPYRHCDLMIDLRAKASKQKRDERFAADHKRRCLGPCILDAPREEYQVMVEQVMAFFEGKVETICQSLKAQMTEAVSAKAFEKAAKIRDRLQTIESLMSTQRVSAPDHANRDVLGLAVEGGSGYVTLFMFREGKLINQENFTLNAIAGGGQGIEGAELTDAEVLTSFLKQYYQRAADIPNEILLPEAIDSQALLQEWLRSLSGRSLQLHAPQRGKNRRLTELARENALSFAKQAQVKWQAGAGQDVQSALEGLKKTLSLPRIPRRIECYDISHLGGVDTVGSMVVFEKGFPKKMDYRHFKLRTVQEKIDDYQAMGEVLTRRFRYLLVQPDNMRKPKKKELETIQAILDDAKLDSADLNVHKTLVVEKRKKIIGIVRLKPLDEEVSELASLWVHPKERGKGLGRELVQWILRKQKKGKIYVIPCPELLDWYGAMGFHALKTVPKELKEKRDFCKANFPDEPVVVMVYRIPKGKEDRSFKKKPDLLVIDGGKGQLNVVVKALKAAHLDIPVVSLAKRIEEVFVPGKKQSILFPEDSDELQLLQRLRDEAHRFALKYQRNLRGKRMLR